MFSGQLDTPDLANFIFKAEQLFVFETNEQLRIALIISRFEKGALTWWKSKSIRDQLPTTWESMKKVLTETFSRVAHRRKLHDKLYQIKQSGSVGDYVERFSEVLNQITDKREEDVIFMFLRGLKEEISTLGTIHPDNIASLQSLVNTCFTIEANKNSYKKNHDEKDPNSVFITKTMEQRWSRLQCGKYGEKGHVKKYCKLNYGGQYSYNHSNNSKQKEKKVANIQSENTSERL